jgi:adenine-specific DNA-methyltransferase
MSMVTSPVLAIPLTETMNPRDPTRQGEYELAWPVRTDGRLGIWRVDADRLRWLYPRGYAVTVKQSRGTWSARYLLEGAIRAIERGELEVVGRGAHGDVVLAQSGRKGTIAKTMWHRGRHAGGGVGGTSLVSAFLGRAGVFSYPKSVYSVRDVIDAAIGDRADALIVDFFAGSGTTAHATFLLNAADGRRRSILVTNNELSHVSVVRLRRDDHHRGDPDFEAHGVFEKATRPRISAAVSGFRADGQPVEGEYLDGRAYAEGFEESVEFLGLDYLDPVAVEMGMAFPRIHPLLWLAAAAVGVRPELDPSSPFALPEDCRYGILFNPSGLPGLLDALMGRPEVTHVFIVADSDVTFADLASAFAAPIVTVHLYRRYLDTLRGAIA